MGLSDLAAAVRGSQALVGAGFVDNGSSRLEVQGEARLTMAEGAEQLGAAPVPVPGPLPVRVSDVADVVLGEEPPIGAAIYDGRLAVYIQVNKLPWADTLAVSRDVEQALADLARELPKGGRIEPPVFRQASLVHKSVRSVGRAMGLGAVLVVLVLFSFLRSGRLAAISLVSIPLSILAAVTLLVALRVSINGMTLGGLSIAVGEVVDDAIVDVENVWRRLRENARLAAPLPALVVIRNASREIRGSVVYATIIVCLVLLPVLLLSGMAGQIFSPLAQAYILSIAASLLVALTVTPAMCAWLLPRLDLPAAQTSLLSRWLVAHYQRLLARVVARPRAVFGSALGLALLAAVALGFLSGGFLPEFQEEGLIVNLRLLPGTALAEVMRVAGRADALVRPELTTHVTARAGRATMDDDANPVNMVEMDLLLRPEQIEDGRIAVAKRLDRLPGVGYAVEGFLEERIHEVLSGEAAPVVVKVVGPELPELRALAQQVAQVMNGTPGLSEVRVEPQLDALQLRIRPDRVALSRYGVDAQGLMDAVTSFRQGRPLTQVLERDGRVANVVLAGPPGWRTRESLADLPIETRRGGLLNLSALAHIDEVSLPALLNHDQGERRISIGAAAQGAGLSRAVALLRQRLAQHLHLPGGYRIDISGEAVARGETAGRLLLLGALVLGGIFLLLAAAFSSLRDAGVVLLNLPLGLIGGVGAALLVPEGLSVSGFIGFVTLFGIIARNGIMLVAHKRHLDAEAAAEDPVERVLRAARERLVPILMTAAAAGLGLLPLALSAATQGSEMEAPMAIIVCGGLLSSTALNMLVLPTLYVWLARRAAAR